LFDDNRLSFHFASSVLSQDAWVKYNQQAVQLSPPISSSLRSSSYHQQKIHLLAFQMSYLAFFGVGILVFFCGCGLPFFFTAFGASTFLSFLIFLADPF
jgi:hypothetical protein